MKFKKIFTSWRVILLLVFLILALLAIQPQFSAEGVTIRSIAVNSSAYQGGMNNPVAGASPLAKERIISINNQETNSVEEYYSLTSQLPVNTTVRVQTTSGTYTVLTKADDPVGLGIKVSEAPRTNIRQGLDLQGGIRVLLQPAEEISSDELEITIDNLQERLNVFGLSDVVVRQASDLAGNDFILIEIAGVTEEEVKELLARQGKFEAKIGNETVFSGGNKDITYVCRGAECSGIGPTSCGPQGGEFFCPFFFSITLSPEAAERQARLTQDLSIVSDGENYLSEDLILYLDDVEVDRLRIGAELKGRATTQIQISGSGSGVTQQDAVENTLNEMKKLQTVIITGSLPTKLDVVKLDTVSPFLGKEFLKNILFVGILAIIVVITIVSVRYRNARVILPMVFIMLSELILILGFAALVGWNLDLAAMAGIIIVAGTAVDHLIVITDETLRGQTTTDWKQKMKNAMFIVTGAYLTTVAGMLPLLWAGAGLLKGFALTTIAGISFGVLIARPAYAAIIEVLAK